MVEGLQEGLYFFVTGCLDAVFLVTSQQGAVAVHGLDVHLQGRHLDCVFQGQVTGDLSVGGVAVEDVGVDCGDGVFSEEVLILAIGQYDIIIESFQVEFGEKLSGYVVGLVFELLDDHSAEVFELVEEGFYRE